MALLIKVRGARFYGDAVMSQATYFHQSCPTCGRHLRVRIDYLGKSVVCQHCRGRFVAYDPECGPPADSDSSISLLQRADELLATASAMRSRPR